MPKAKAGPGFYAVKRGRNRGVYSTWKECEAEVKGYPGAIHKKFSTAEEAMTFAGWGWANQSHGSRSHSASSSRAHPRPQHARKPYDRSQTTREVKTLRPNAAERNHVYRDNGVAGPMAKVRWEDNHRSAPGTSNAPPTFSMGNCEIRANGYLTPHGTLHNGFSTPREIKKLPGRSLRKLKWATSKLHGSLHTWRPYEPITAAGRIQKLCSEISAGIVSLIGGELVLYTEGVCVDNDRSEAMAGIGVWWGQGDKRNIFERCPGDQTHEHAALISIIRALEMAPPAVPLLIKNSSPYGLSCTTTWLPVWDERDYDPAFGKLIRNESDVHYLATLLEARAGPVRFERVYEHEEQDGREGAVGLATAGCQSVGAAERMWAFYGPVVSGLHWNNEEDNDICGEETLLSIYEWEREWIDLSETVNPNPAVTQDLEMFYDGDGSVDDPRWASELASTSSSALGKVTRPRFVEADDLFFTTEEIAAFCEEVVLSD
ncbi:hypothetical protein BOTBODRAFT_53986 [Botryobasidium botryosum FD-172 SS1]|uniref:ribonuclease H n=1 Tax=Botryobasidium botryosum (strain FD-172 SS1) TaxID=930990 RepID=A0A067MLW0_BOTB1|nr:hypothetical protein BOTBODRAFT_53986 [Botryobasidium botryosum FD-172 SS1]